MAAERNGEKRLKKQASDATNWTTSRVDEWSKTFELNESLKTVLFPCNGELLYQYYKIYRKTPEYFLKKLGSDSKCEPSLKDIANLLNQLEKLFE